MSGFTLSPPPRVPRTSPKGGLYRGLGQLARELVLGWFGSWSGAGLEVVWQLVQDLVHGVGVFALCACFASAYLTGLAILADTLRIATINAKTPLVASYVHMLELLTLGALESPCAPKQSSSQQPATNQSTNQPFNRPTNQPINQPPKRHGGGFAARLLDNLSN